MTENKRFKEQNLENHLNRIYDTKKGKVVFDEDVLDLLNDLNNENEKLQFKLKECHDNKLFSRRELEKENERIKHMIQEAYNNERTQIGKSVLKQLMEQIQ